MREIAIYLKSGKVIRDPIYDPEKFSDLCNFMVNEECKALVIENRAWIKKEEIIVIILDENELYKNSDLPQ